MSGAYTITGECMREALQRGRQSGVDEGMIARAMLSQVLDAFRARRTLDDIRHELEFVIENLDPDRDHEFMRP